MSDDIDQYLEGLFETARNDGASRMPTSQRRVLDAAIATAAGTAALSTHKSGTWAKASLVGALVVGFAVLAIRSEENDVRPAADVGVAPVIAPAPPAAAGAVTPAADDDSTPAIPSITVDQLPPSPLPTKSAQRPATIAPIAPIAPIAVPAIGAAVEAKSESSSDPARPLGSIAEQIRLVDSARRHVAAREGREAIAVLDEYGKRFPNGALDEEASALRVEALDRAGDHAAAVELGRRFLRTHPDSAYATRVALVIGKSPSHD